MDGNEPEHCSYASGSPGEEHEAINITGDFIPRLVATAVVMEGAKAKQNLTTLALNVVRESVKSHEADKKGSFPKILPPIMELEPDPKSGYPKAILEGVKILLHHFKLPDISDEDIKKLPPEAISELLDKGHLFITIYNKLKAHQPWDFKTSVYKKHKDEGVFVSGSHYNYDITGNIVWGYAGAAAGISESTLRMMAGLGQKQMGTSEPQWTWEGSYYDDPRDQAAIKAGYYLYSMYKTDVDDDRLKEALDYANVSKMDADDGQSSSHT